ncbi:putative phage-associated protein [Rhodovulum sulfidophilum]|uniref:Panacea domain-containing protein n=1 Tax=Rhodovulum sulfidophilum TaxID=35806 RepID=UPI0005A9FE72|nr:Panacea domain-containing protein [Rhodovulum sulfidophilum]MCW2304867.1 putative phage-associated protein [Rhodovulum sulfidophilum]
MSTESTEFASMTPSVPRILASLYHVMKEACGRKASVSQYHLVKTLFLADRAHLNEWGRPITYDNYTAMYHGPVPSLAYDFLKGNLKALRDSGVAKLPWRTVERNEKVKNYYPIDGELDPEEFLSESDIQALNDALTIVLRLGFGQIRKLTHEDSAYVDAWRDDGGKAAYKMKLGLLFDEPNFDQAAMLAEYSPYV